MSQSSLRTYYIKNTKWVAKCGFRKGVFDTKKEAEAFIMGVGGPYVPPFMQQKVRVYVVERVDDGCKIATSVFTRDSPTQEAWSKQTRDKLLHTCFVRLEKSHCVQLPYFNPKWSPKDVSKEYIRKYRYIHSE